MNSTSVYTAQSALAQLPRQDFWLWRQAEGRLSEVGLTEARGPAWNTASTWGGPAGRGLRRGRWPGCGERPPQPPCHRFWGLPSITWLPLPTLTCVGARGLWPFGETQGRHRHVHHACVYWGSAERVLYQGKMVLTVKDDSALCTSELLVKTEARDADVLFVHIAGFLLTQVRGLPWPRF